MDRAKVENVTAEIGRFIERAKEYIARIDKEAKFEYRCYTTKQGGALRRASLDLTRALAKMRKY